MQASSTFDQKLFTEWDQEKNGAAKLSDYKAGSEKKVWWKCDKGHSWNAVIRSRVKGSGCPYCTNQRVLAGYNDLATRYPNIAAQFDADKNNPLQAEGIAPGTHKKVWWRCSKGHSWKAAVNSRTRLNAGCPYCSGKKAISGQTDLATVNPKLSKEFDLEKNYPKTPSDIMCHSNKKVWWNCDNGHSWEATPNNRSKGKGCPYCTNRRVLYGYNDLGTAYPELAAQFDCDKNNGIQIDEINSGSKQKVWWKCAKGHSWKTSFDNRSRGSGCPTCWSKTFVSKSEQELLEVITSLTSDAIGTYKKLSNVSEVDIFIPRSNIAIEYNGLYWHSELFKDEDYHYKKWLACKEQGIQLLQIWEDEWQNKSDVVESLLAHKLGKSTKQRVYARSTSVKEILAQEAATFLEKNHIQGSVGGSIRVGLVHTEKLVALGLFRRRDTSTLELVRYATSCHVVGGQGKILKHVKKNYPQYKKVVTFADHSVSDGGLYEKLGFVNDGLVPPDYKYLVNGRLEHKFNYRIKRFRDDPSLYYEEGLSERELAKLNGLLRVYDAGKTRYVLYL